jgi:hypothetical protein
VAEIAWGAWQRKHITERHGVSAHAFDTAWHDPYRKDLATERHKARGVYFVSVGFAAERALKMIWRWQGDLVWPITAYFPKRSRSRRRR